MGWYLFWLPSVTKTKYASFGTPTWWDVQIGCFWPILRNFTDQDGQKGESHENEFWVFQIQKRMLPTNRAEKVDEKNGVIYLVFMFPLWVVKLFKRVKFFFPNFVRTSARNLSLLFICIWNLSLHCFKKMIWFIGVWATIHEIWMIKT